MSSASPFLEQLLTGWGTQTGAVRYSHDAAIDAVLHARHHLDDQRILITQCFQIAWQVLETQSDSSYGRLADSLQLADAWAATLSRIRQACDQTGAIVSSGQWLDKAAPLAVPLRRLLDRSSDRLTAGHDTLYVALSAWQALLDAKEIELHALKEKDGNQRGSLLLSRARKQPELEFIQAQIATEAELGRAMQSARRQLHQSMDRLYKATSLLERHASSLPALYESRKAQLLDVIRPAHERLFGLRELILSDALIFETCRRKLRWVQTSVQSIRCLEDVYKAPEPGWKKLFR